MPTVAKRTRRPTKRSPDRAVENIRHRRCRKTGPAWGSDRPGSQTAEIEKTCFISTAYRNFHGWHGGCCTGISLPNK
jgi:hypothetical protein